MNFEVFFRPSNSLYTVWNNVFAKDKFCKKENSKCNDNDIFFENGSEFNLVGEIVSLPILLKILSLFEDFDVDFVTFHRRVAEFIQDNNQIDFQCRLDVIAFIPVRECGLVINNFLDFLRMRNQLIFGISKVILDAEIFQDIVESGFFKTEATVFAVLKGGAHLHNHFGKGFRDFLVNFAL